MRLMNRRYLSQMVRLLLVTGCVAYAVPVRLAMAETAGVDITSTHQGRRVTIGMRTTVAAPYSVIWATLTDYDNTSRWITGMDRSVVLRRKPGGALVEQSGHADILFFNMAVNVVLEVDEQPPERIGVKAVRGDFSHLEGEYRLIPVAGATDLYDLTWRGEMELASPVPGFLAQPILRANIRQRFESLVAEIQRRTRAVPKK